MNKPKLLIVDDDEAICTQLKYALRDHFTLFFAEEALYGERPGGVDENAVLGLPNLCFADGAGRGIAGVFAARLR